jgi:uncharacterized protein YjdB
MTEKLKLMACVLLMAAFASSIASCDDNDITPVQAIGVILNRATLTLAVGDTATLTATVAPDNAADQTLTWTGSEPAVATVADGLVTAVAVGSATVTVATANGKTAACAVTVVEAAIAVESVTLDTVALTLHIDKTYTLTATVLPDDATDQTLTWTSSEPAVATVADGLVTAVALGSTTVTVATANGKTADCQVTVEAIEVTDITLDRQILIFSVGGSEILTATVTPGDATDQTLTWTSSEPTVATVADGLVAAVAVGYATITAATANGKTASCEVTVTPFETVLIPSGTFLMGSSNGSNTGSGTPNVDVNATPAEPDRATNERQRRVTLTKDYYMSRYLITNAQYAVFLNNVGVGSNGKKADIQDEKQLIKASAGNYDWGLHWNGSAWLSVAGYENHPEINVSWYGAKAYAEWVGGNLPTEAQWERAARGGIENMPFGMGDGKTLTANMANFEGTYPYNFDNGGTYNDAAGVNLMHTTEISAYSDYANDYGLYDMHGNLAEWCLDRWDGTDNYAGLSDTDPLCTEGSSCVTRGGGWNTRARFCRSAFRNSAGANLLMYHFGFRVVFNN